MSLEPPHKPIDHDADAPAAGTGSCAQCGSPPDGSEQSRLLDGGEVLWLHAGCEDAFAKRRLSEEGLGSSPLPAAPTTRPIEDQENAANENQENDAGAEPEPEAELVPDRDALMGFVEVLFRNAARDGFVSFRVFEDNGRSEAPIHLQAMRLDDPEFEPIMTERARQAAVWWKPAVFAPPVCTFKSHLNAKTDNIHEGPVLSVECDERPSAARRTLEALLGPATLVVESGGEWTDPETGEVESKLHLHWRLIRPAASIEEQALLHEARALAAKLVGADPTCIPVVHPMRWPGSWHRKREPKLARVVALAEGAEIELADAVARLREAAGVSEPNAFERHGIAGNGAAEASDHSAVAQALAVIPNDITLRDAKGKLVHDWEYWNKTGMTIWASTAGSEEGRAAFHEWSKKAGAKYDANETDARWDHYFKSPPNRLGFGSLVFRAREVDPNWRYENHASDRLAAAVGGLIAQIAKERDEPDDTGEDGIGGTAGAASGSIEPVDLWGKLDTPGLPLGILPKIIEQFARDRAEATGADPCGFAVTALAVCAGAISDEFKLQPKRHDTEWLESTRLWTLLIGDPSGLKSPIMQAATKPLRKINAKLARDYQAAKERWDQRPKDEKGDPPPPKRRAMIFDTTIESAQEILRDSPAGVLLENDELSGWFDSMYKYSGGRGAQTDRSFWLKAYDGGARTVDRISRGMVHIENLSISIAGASQPGPIRKLANAGEDDGLLQRFNPLMLRPATGGRDEPPGAEVSNYDTLIERLRSLAVPPFQAVFKLDNGALKIREELERKHLLYMQADWLNRKLTSHIGKYNGMFARLCLLFHLVDYASVTGPLAPPPPLVIPESIAKRVKDFLHGFLLKHAIAFYSNVLGLSNDHERLANLADYILAKGLTHVTNRDRTMRELERHETTAIFEQLEALGWVDIVPSPKHGYLPHWVVNPVVHQRFAKRAKESKERRARGHEIAREISTDIKCDNVAKEG